VNWPTLFLHGGLGAGGLIRPPIHRIIHHIPFTNLILPVHEWILALALVGGCNLVLPITLLLRPAIINSISISLPRIVNDGASNYPKSTRILALSRLLLDVHVCGVLLLLEGAHVTLFYWTRLIIQILFKRCSTIVRILAEAGAELALSLAIRASLISFFHVVLVALVVDVECLNFPTLLRLCKIEISLVL